MAVPFPTIHQQSSPSTPSLSNHWENTDPTPNLFGSPTPKPPAQTPERPSQPHTPLTPPLTPASSANNDNAVGHVQGTYATTPARGSVAPPPTPSSAGLLAHARSHAQPDVPPSPVAVSSGIGLGWSGTPPCARPHRLDIGIGIGSSPASDIDLSDGTLPDGDRCLFDMADGPAREGREGRNERGIGSLTSGTGGERFLFISGVPRDVPNETIKDAFRPFGDVKGLCLRLQEKQGVIILAFYDTRHTTHAERQVASQTFFGNLRLHAKKMTADALRRLMGESSFIDDTEGEVLLTAEGGKIDANSLQSIVSGFGELRAFNHTNMPSTQAYVVEFFDSRNARTAVDQLNGRSIFGIRLCLVHKHAAADILTSVIPFPQNAEQNRVSQPSSPLNSFSNLHSSSFSHPLSLRHDSFNYSSDNSLDPLEQQHSDEDTTNSSPFHGTRALPPLHPHALVLHAGGARRISTGSVNISALETPLHQSTSEQDLRRRAAVAAANAAGAQNSADLGFDSHMRRTSDTFCFDTLRKLAGQVGILQTDTAGLLRPRTRAISESSASPRVISPSDDFPALGLKDAHAPACDGPSTPENSQGVSSERTMYYGEHDDESERSLAHGHSRAPTASDSSPGGPHTPSPPSDAVYATPYYAHGHSPVHAHAHAHALAVAHQAALLGMPISPPSMLSPHHGPYYLNPSTAGLASPMSTARLGGAYPYPAAGFSPGSTGSASSLTSSPSSLVPHAPAIAGGQHLPASARSALDVTRDAPPERNQVDLNKIEAGLDTRTTVMIKNIPNKLSDKDLIDFINKVCPRKIDFLYLRMDFQNGCNVGYAFVNFIHVQDLLHFARTKLGVKWNMFSSEKVLQMSYANYQGKEALVEKFKNSCVMDERESWRPKIFYSTGPNQGLPEPFPAPTHFRRKERSAQNRGALFVPSPPNTTVHGNGGGMLGHQASFRRPNQHPQNLARHERY